MYDVLLHELLTLKAALDRYNIPVMIGGGMGLYLRDVYLQVERQPRYPFAPPARSTQDLDVFLTADLIVDSEAMVHIRDTLAALGYQPEVRYFQFVKTVALAGHERKVKIDLLAAPPREEDRSAVKINRPRIRPHGSQKIHAYLAEEAHGLEIGLIPIDLGAASQGYAVKDALVFIPSSFNYLILKLHAFNDRKEREDSDLGRHHALDVFRIVTGMTETDWTTARQHFEAERELPYLQRAIQIQQTYFAQETDLGVLRLKENEGYRQYRGEFDVYISDFLEDMRDLFSPGLA